MKRNMEARNNQHKSSSMEQQRAEEIILKQVCRWLGMELEHGPKIFVGSTFMQPDFYSKEEGVIGEISAHIGRTNKAQDNKIANDLLKMLLLEKLEGRNYRKIIVVCDENVYAKLCGTSILAQCVQEFGVEVKMMDIDGNLRADIVSAQTRQRMVNA
ncbi:hypothetical protein D7X94_02405 [Acutalibacter sp. 1XD8-33]|uniref:hypothetical protein n=1 Tax=Acutalibacter sp. 1XD8-33 TaxID=2320081 RepID=UPI000EA0EA85|nr:hypothetical protein [Acutalibacter sp. 1XD8-33]RKJ41686.1 hypothetical protein D7X94_02405 [Acutalibacter sp. 1XD8-33]